MLLKKIIWWLLYFNLENQWKKCSILIWSMHFKQLSPNMASKYKLEKEFCCIMHNLGVSEQDSVMSNVNVDDLIAKEW